MNRSSQIFIYTMNVLSFVNKQNEGYSSEHLERRDFFKIWLQFSDT